MLNEMDESRHHTDTFRCESEVELRSFESFHGKCTSKTAAHGHTHSELANEKMN